jgi:hypothetical protein
MQQFKELLRKNPWNTKPQFYTVMVIPAPIYGCESWSINSSDKCKSETVEMRFLRQTAVQRHIDQIRNAETDQKLNPPNFTGEEGGIQLVQACYKDG